MAISESEKVIRTLYQITTENYKGFPFQVNRLLELGCERFSLDIGILSKIKVNANDYTVVHCKSPKNLPIQVGEVFDYKKTYCALTVAADGPVGFEHMSASSMKFHPAFDYFPLESYIATPVKVNNKLYGTLSFSSLTPAKRKFSDIDVDALQLMASWLGAELLHIENSLRLKEANERLTELANTDSLTNLNNRRAFQNFFERFIRHAKRVDMPMSIILLDVDFFKKFNDTYGHIAGDNVLKKVATLLVENCRESDFVARFGGEEFIIMLPNTDKEGALILAQNLCDKFHQTDWPKAQVTASFGVSTSDYQMIKSLSSLKSCEFVTDSADKALYESKQQGRNRVTHFSDL